HFPPAPGRPARESAAFLVQLRLAYARWQEQLCGSTSRSSTDREGRESADGGSRYRNFPEFADPMKRSVSTRRHENRKASPDRENPASLGRYPDLRRSPAASR